MPKRVTALSSAKKLRFCTVRFQLLLKVSGVLDAELSCALGELFVKLNLSGRSVVKLNNMKNP